MEMQQKRAVVLVVEDETILNMDVAEAIREEGFPVLQAYSAEDAVRQLEDHPGVRVVFTDVNLPGMSGLQLAAEVARRWPQIEVLITSGRLVPEVAAFDAVARYGRFVPKPYPPEAVTRRIHEIVGARP